MIAAGATTRELAAQLRISHAAARSAVQRLLTKLDVRSRAAAVSKVLLTEIAARKAAEEGLAAQSLVTRLLAGSSTLAEAGPRLLAQLGETLDWDVGDVWLVDNDLGVLRSAASWRRAGDDLADFVAISLNFQFSRGKGLPGRVWASGEPAWIADVLDDPRFLRRAAARTAGIHDACAFPVIRPDGELVGVLDLLSRRIRPRDPALMVVLADIGRQIGQFVQRERAEAERDRVLTAVEQSADGILITDTVGTIIYANAAIERLSGYTRDELLGKSPRIFKSGLRDAAYYAQLWTALQAGRTWSSTMVNRCKDGTTWEVDSVISPVKDLAGAPVGYVQLARDVTRERELEAQLRQAQKMESVGLLAGGIAHDFNNILTVISGNSQFLLTDLARDDPLRADIEQIDAAAQRAAALTRQLLAFSRRQALQANVLDLNTVVDGISAILRRLLGDDVTVVTTLGPDLGAVVGDRTQLEQVVMNLAINARDAMPSGGTLTLETANVELDAEFAETHPGVTPGRCVRFVVRDTGFGMDAKTMARIFEPYFTTKALGRGTGLGLATVYGIVKQLGGYIDVVSEGAVGTTFSIYLPRAEGPVRPVTSLPRN